MRAALFVTCFNDTLFPGTGRAVVELLERLGVEVAFPEEQTCCGQMHVNSGYAEQGTALARRFERVFGDAEHVVSPSASCVAMVREHCPAVADRVCELTEFLVDVLEVEDVGASFPHRVAYHPTCHSLRLLKVGDRPLRLLRAVQGIDLVEIEQAQECCGFGGTFAVKNADTSMAMLSDKLRHVLDTGAEVCTVGRQLVPDAHRRRAAAPAHRGAGAPPGRDPGGARVKGFPAAARRTLRDSQLRRMNPYTSLWTGVRDGDGPREFHLVLLDNGRTDVLRDEVGRQALHCIRCSACLNVCPVYSRTGGQAYESVYPGPIGAILTPQLKGLGEAPTLPWASSLCGACYEACPVKILRDYHPAGFAAVDVDLFCERVADYRATVHRVSGDELAAALAEVAARLGLGRVGTTLDFDLGEVELVSDDPPLSVAELDGLDGVLTGCALGIADTGTLVLDGAGSSGRRALTLVPDVHLCVIAEDQVVASVPDAVARLAAAAGEGRPITLVSGPSATSDIELDRVEGVHGPRTLEVFVVG